MLKKILRQRNWQINEDSHREPMCSAGGFCIYSGVYGRNEAKEGFKKTDFIRTFRQKKKQK